MLEIRNLSKKMNGLDLIKDFSLTVKPEEIISVVGTSGSGKTTLIRILNELENADKGDILLDGKSYLTDKNERVKNKIGMVFQDFQLFPNLTVKENCTLSPVLNKQLSRKEAEKKAEDLLEKLSIKEKEAAYPKELSGGQKQRVAIARALMLEPEIICLDEPTSALDYETAERFGEQLRTIARNGVGILIITHDLSFAKKFSHRIVSSKEFLPAL